MSSAATKQKKNLKQGNLFSFFSTSANNNKKKTTTKPAATAPSTTTSTRSCKPISTSSPKSISQSQSSPKKKKSNKVRNSLWKQVNVGNRLLVLWPNDKQYYAAQVMTQNAQTSTFTLEYDDGETEQLDLQYETFKFLKEQTNKKRRQIDEEDEEEFEFNDEPASSDDEEDGSVYEGNEMEQDDDDDDDDEADQWMVTDNEEEELSMTPPPKKKRKQQATKKSMIQVTQHKASPRATTSTTTATTTATTTTTTVVAPTYKTPLRQFANTVSPSTNSSKKSMNSTFHKTPAAIKRTPPAPRQLHKQEETKVLMFTKGVVNPKGSHVHNHLKFLQHPKDSNGRSPGEDAYDPRTLKISMRDWEAVYGGKMTNAVEQWWELKSRYFDTVLLFKTGKFYEMFHMDADIGVSVLGLIYMKGHVAHGGFPEISYGPMADKLCRAGYKVARVEQTETPDQLKVRKDKTPKGRPKPKVVNREVCSILTLGTRTFCCLDDANALSNAMSNDGSGLGPLLAISEVLVVDNNTTATTNDDDAEEEDQVQPTCEYGITLVDAVNGTVTIGQFADDVLRSRMNTLLMAFGPSEILISSNASPTFLSQIKAYQNSTRNGTRLEVIHDQEAFPKSTALDSKHRTLLQRKNTTIHPWDVDETIQEVHRRGYYPRGSKKNNDSSEINTSRWPKVLQAAIDGKADLCISSLGATLFYLQRNLIDQEILSMGIVKAYIPPASSCIISTNNNKSDDDDGEAALTQHEEGVSSTPAATTAFEGIQPVVSSAEDQIKNMSLDGTTLHNLEILTNAVDHKPNGSLWSKINYTKTPHGSRLLRAWLLRPLFRKEEIERRSNAVQELVAGAGAVALNEARQTILGKIGDLDRLLSRLHSMSGPTDHNNDNEPYHPSERAVLYESKTYTKRKVGDFSKLLNGLRRACQIPDLFADLDLENDGLLRKIVRFTADGGFFPVMADELDWYFENFDCDKAAKGEFEPSRGCDETYDEACDTIERIQAELEDYRRDMCNELRPRHTAKSSWKYINTKADSKDKYLIELPASVEVPSDFQVKGKRGSGHKQVNKYRTSFVAGLIQELERAFEVQKVRKAKGMQLIFAKFNKQRSLWSAAAHTTAILDALGSLAKVAAKPGYCRPTILDCPAGQEPTINIVQGRHPCVESNFNGTEFIPNDLALGRLGDGSRLLLLSGPNMGGKSTLLRQTCLIAIMAQLGSYVPAESCELTPIDCIYTRLGASDRILLGQSTFFVELAETAAALRGATRRSLVIMDELGRGTSTFDGTAIAGATVKHLVERSQCLSLFATHYHSLLSEWEHEPKVRLGHMECMAEGGDDDADGSHITFLYTLGPGTCPKSFGINVARLASLPQEVLVNAKRVSEEFEEEMNSRNHKLPSMNPASAMDYKEKIIDAIKVGDWETLQLLQKEIG